MICGYLPYPLDGILRHHLVTPPTPMRKYVPGVPEELDQVILKCLEKDRDQRYRSAKDIYADLKQVSEILFGRDTADESQEQV
jgi:serine/threonine-protein kinase